MEINEEAKIVKNQYLAHCKVKYCCRFVKMLQN